MPSRFAERRADALSKKRKRTAETQILDRKKSSTASKSTSTRKTPAQKKPITKLVTEAEEDDDEDGDEEGDDTAAIQAKIMQLEQDIVASSKNYNCIVQLLEHLEVGGDEMKSFRCLLLTYTREF